VRPLIGITCSCVSAPDNQESHGEVTLNWNYAEAVAEAGGNPIVIPPTAQPSELAPLLDGWLITGGLDIPPEFYNGAPHPTLKLADDARVSFEFNLLREVHPQLPILGICYGCQFLNIARGGGIEQHLPDRLGHHSHAGGELQSYRMASGSRLQRFVGLEEVRGKSYHHQAVGSIGRALEPVAWHEDGTIEAIEDSSLPFFVGVQWHPERTPDAEESKNLFLAFVQAAAAFQRGKVSERATI